LDNDYFSPFEPEGFLCQNTLLGWNPFRFKLSQGEFMASRIKARGGESIEQMMRRFKKLCEKEGLTKDIKRRAYYEKPSERKQRSLRKSIKRSDYSEIVQKAMKLGAFSK
jgi:small subunit ribosomal protein S21